MKPGSRSERGVLETLARGARVLIIRLRSLGDSVLTTPALQLLKQARPDLRVAVMVEPRFAAIFEENPDVETILTPGLGQASSNVAGGGTSLGSEAGASAARAGR